MQTMPSKLTGLTLRGRVYWIRTRIPADIRDTYPKREELDHQPAHLVSIGRNGI